MALGILLPTMHHSSLGALMLIAPNKLHQLWYSPLLPLLFLVSSVAMGYAVVVAESALSSVAFRRQREGEMLTSLSTVMVGVLAAFLGMRIVDLISRQRIGLAFAMDFYAGFFWMETALFVGAAALLLPREWRRDAGKQMLAALLMMLGGTLYRFDVFLVGFNPGPQWSYFPSVAEMILTIGLIAIELMAYFAIVKRFPVIGGAAVTRPPVRAAGAAVTVA
jgi:Ni/Fe-hydrogenase subunit HybB-like protein